MKKISTSTHKISCEMTSYTTYDITGFWMREFHPHDKIYPKLEPEYSIWKKWEQNSENFEEEDNDKRYVEQYYEQVLSKLDPEQVYNEIGVTEEYGGSIILCDDKITRYIVAAWFKLLLGEEVLECGIIEKIGKIDFDINSAQRIYSKIIESYLEEVMRKKYDLKEFQSLRAKYLLTKAEKVEKIASKLGKDHKDYASYMQYAYYLSSHAHALDVEYDNSISKKMEHKDNS